MSIRFAALASAALFAAVPAQAEAPDPVALVDARASDTARVARQIWEWAEVGYKEDKSSGLLASVERYDPGTASWSTLAPMPTARGGLEAVAV